MPALRSGTWAVLFTDFVGSTEQRGRLGDEAADALLREHDHIVLSAISSRGGLYVNGL